MTMIERFRMRPRHSPAATAAPPAWHESYVRGLADGRRTTEAEVDAERRAIALLANSMASVVEQLVFRLNPDDLAKIGQEHFDIHVMTDAMLLPGAVRAEGRLL